VQERRRGVTLLVLIPAVLGLVVGFLAIEFDWPIPRESVGGVVPSKPDIPGMGFVILLVVATVGFTSLISATRQARARRPPPDPDRRSPP
jgi:hypothetical protein